MKKTGSLSIIIAMAICIGCSSPTPTPMLFKKATVKKDVALSAESDAPLCSVVLNVDYAACSNAETAKTINDAIERRLFNMQGLTMQEAADSFASQYTRDYKENLKALYEEDKQDPQKKDWYKYRYNIDTETRTGRDDAVVYLMNLNYYEGGAHGIEQLLAMNFDRHSGRQLNLQDVFVPGFEARLTELLLKKLMDHADAKDPEELKAKDYLFTMDMFPSENFILGSDHLTFIYNAYEIAPYAKGRTELEVGYSEVEDIMKR